MPTDEPTKPRRGVVPVEGCFSNFADISVRWQGIVYPTSEHAFQAGKTLDKEMREYIASQPTPGNAKHAGRLLKPPKFRADWEQVKVEVMRDVIRNKFNPNCLWTKNLLKTAGMWIVEFNTWRDRVWGATQNAEGIWVGQNNLGKCLMDVRKEVLSASGVSDDWTTYTDTKPWSQDGTITAGLDCFHQ